MGEFRDVSVVDWIAVVLFEGKCLYFLIPVSHNICFLFELSGTRIVFLFTINWWTDSTREIAAIR